MVAILKGFIIVFFLTYSISIAQIDTTQVLNKRIDSLEDSYKKLSTEFLAFKNDANKVNDFYSNILNAQGTIASIIVGVVVALTGIFSFVQFQMRIKDLKVEYEGKMTELKDQIGVKEENLKTSISESKDFMQAQLQDVKNQLTEVAHEIKANYKEEVDRVEKRSHEIHDKHIQDVKETEIKTKSIQIELYQAIGNLYILAAHSNRQQLYLTSRDKVEVRKENIRQLIVNDLRTAYYYYLAFKTNYEGTDKKREQGHIDMVVNAFKGVYVTVDSYKNDNPDIIKRIANEDTQNLDKIITSNMDPQIAENAIKVRALFL